MNFKIEIQNDDDRAQAYVIIPESAAPEVEDCDGSDEIVRDYGNADWPTDEEVGEAASKMLGVPVTARWSDAGDSLLEGIYDLDPRATLGAFIVKYYDEGSGTRYGHLVVAESADHARRLVSVGHAFAMSALTVEAVDMSVGGEITNWDETDW